MSGGVDSSVTAALLHEQGYDVVGITLQLYDHGVAIQAKGACCAGADIHDARTVAGRLGIPHYVLDYESRFADQVMQDFADSYLRGETPIPCVRCNQTVKFTDLLTTARELGADCLATGHYVRRVDGPDGPELHRGADAAKDQSYFLFATTPDQLDYLRFPLGGMSKDETRELACRYQLTVADKPDSQDICFVPNGRYGDVVRRLRPGAVEAGEIVHMDGTVLGRHDGVIDFTIGQRRGIGIGEKRLEIAMRVPVHHGHHGSGACCGVRSRLLISSGKSAGWCGAGMAVSPLSGRRYQPIASLDKFRWSAAEGASTIQPPPRTLSGLSAVYSTAA